MMGIQSKWRRRVLEYGKLAERKGEAGGHPGGKRQPEWHALVGRVGAMAGRLYVDMAKVEQYNAVLEAALQNLVAKIDETYYPKDIEIELSPEIGAARAVLGGNDEEEN